MFNRILVFTIVFCAYNYAQEPGRTDGPEESEFGRGGYSFGEIKNSWNIQTVFGSASVKSEGKVALKNVTTDLYYGLKIGYRLDSFDFNAGYRRIDQQNTDFFGFGVTREMPVDGIPDVELGFSLGSETIKRDNLDTEFSIVPGISAAVILGDRFDIGVDYRRSIVFSDYNVSINCFGAYIKIEL
jgi:hypothetical protein